MDNNDLIHPEADADLSLKELDTVSGGAGEGMFSPERVMMIRKIIKESKSQGLDEHEAKHRAIFSLRNDGALSDTEILWLFDYFWENGEDFA